MSERYILENGCPVPCDDLLEWAAWFEKPGLRRVDETQIGNYTVSTVFLALDHSFGGIVPILWETMVFEGESFSDIWSERCGGDIENAKAMHQRGIDFLNK